MSEPGFLTINGADVAVTSGDRFLGTVANDDLSLLHLAVTDWVTVAGGGGDDRFFGAAGRLAGGAGADTFFSEGAEGTALARLGPGLVNGGAGDDLMLDTFGATDYRGGSGRDLFSTMQQAGGFAGISRSRPGDVDRVWLGAGDDTAVIRFTTFSDEQGTRLEERLVVLDGGAGTDRLVILSTDLFGNLSGNSQGLLDFAGAGAGTLVLNNATATGFEAFDLRITLGALSTLRTAGEEDRIEVLGSVVETVTGRHAYRIEAGAGDDRVIGTDGATAERIFGQGGNDVLIAQGSGLGDTLFGGTGNDILAASAFTAATLDVRMQGGTGRDLFLVGASGGADQRIADFVPGEDRIVFNDGLFWAFDLDLSAAAIRAGLQGDFVVNTDTEALLDLTIDLGTPGFPMADIHLRYDRGDGTLYSRNDAAAPWLRIGEIAGAPNLGIDDFAFL